MTWSTVSQNKSWNSIRLSLNRKFFLNRHGQKPQQYVPWNSMTFLCNDFHCLTICPCYIVLHYFVFYCVCLYCTVPNCFTTCCCAEETYLYCISIFAQCFVCQGIISVVYFCICTVFCVCRGIIFGQRTDSAFSPFLTFFLNTFWRWWSVQMIARCPGNGQMNQKSNLLLNKGLVKLFPITNKLKTRTINWNKFMINENNKQIHAKRKQ